MTSGTLIYIQDLWILEKIFIRITGFYNTPLFYPEPGYVFAHENMDFQNTMHSKTIDKNLKSRVKVSTNSGVFRNYFAISY